MNIFLGLHHIVMLILCIGFQLVSGKNSIKSVEFTIKIIWSSFLAYVLIFALGFLNEPLSSFGFKIDPLSALMTLLILFISGIVHLFSLRYMKGDRRFYSYFLKLALLTGSALGFAISDHLVLACIFWILNQIFLSGLMIHKPEWNSAKEAGKLFLKWSLCGTLSLVAGIAILAIKTKSSSISVMCIRSGQIDYVYKFIAFFFIFFASIVQSGLWPLHRWLMSSLNSPTPVSAFMHAGLVNGGGFLLARFSFLVLSEDLFLKVLIAFGVISMILGSIWKLLQNNVKKMLVCSTIAQMGFMFLQCGLGLFPAAVAHMCWHGLFKAFLFLNSGSSIQNNHPSDHPLTLLPCIYSIMTAGIGILAFCFASGFSISSLDTQGFLILFAGVAAFHVSLAAFRYVRQQAFLVAGLLTTFLGFLYGTSIHLIESLLKGMDFWSPQPLTGFHFIAIAMVLGITISMNYFPLRWQKSKFWKITYVKLLNSSQSEEKTITAFRNEYQF